MCCAAACARARLHGVSSFFFNSVVLVWGYADSCLVLGWRTPRGCVLYGVRWLSWVLASYHVARAAGRGSGGVFYSFKPQGRSEAVSAMSVSLCPFRLRPACIVVYMINFRRALGVVQMRAT